ncbi:MAG: 2-hydroxyacid dehydrogenase [Actinobacteria bacterium]|nr:2-hydroxyacid dehydrogenase [Actinomycetota bacterium]MBU1944491.1 2-hydroxyacid dehydrogenase [Actinomycetota bacterium]MBU2688656.1 2-hydroxyacid dehydrogenase [Actinomycetota bacterium]
MSEKTILVLSPLPAALVEALFKAAARGEAVEEARAVVYEGSSRGELLEAVKDADVIIGDYTFNIEMDLEVMEAAAPCLLIQQPSTGYQHIDIDAAARAGIPVANVAGANAVAVAEHTIMMILGCLKRLTLCHELTRGGEWAQDEMATRYGGVFELEGKTVGIVGMGRIGREVAARARPFGCAMVYYDPVRLSPDVEAACGVSYRELDDLVSQSDVVTVHVPLTPETENMFDEERIARMKPNAVFANVSRGGLADEKALAAALSEGRLMGAGLDVFSSEPVDPDNPLLKAPNTILTPHTAGATNESRLRIIGVALKNVATVLAGGSPEFVVNGVL